MAKYSCKTCGAELYFDPKSGKLNCEYCNSQFDPSEYAYLPDDEAQGTAGASSAEHAESSVDHAESAEGQYATDDSVNANLVIYKCPHCGAEVITSKETAATTCVYCNRAITLEGNLSGEFQPDYILPFEKERKEVEDAYRKLCRQSILTPRLFTKEATVKKIKGMYIPFWLYSFTGNAVFDVSASNVRTWTTGDTEYTETESYNITEGAAGQFQYIPEDAMKAMDNMLMDSLEPFDFSKLQKFNPAYLAGFYTQRWDDDAATNDPRAKVRAKSALQQAAMKNVGTYGQVSIRSESYDWTNQKVDYAMMPVWMMYTEYKGKNYLFGMNGQTGKMVGTIPKDPMRLAEIGAGVFVISQRVMMALRVLGVM